MKTIYSLLHFANKTPKRLSILIPAHAPDLDKEEGVIISIVAEDNSQAFALNTAEISEFNAAITYAGGMLEARKIATINAKYGGVK